MPSIQVLSFFPSSLQKAGRANRRHQRTVQDGTGQGPAQYNSRTRCSERTQPAAWETDITRSQSKTVIFRTEHGRTGQDRTAWGDTRHRARPQIVTKTPKQLRIDSPGCNRCPSTAPRLRCHAASTAQRIPTVTHKKDNPYKRGGCTALHRVHNPSLTAKTGQASLASWKPQRLIDLFHACHACFFDSLPRGRWMSFSDVNSPSCNWHPDSRGGVHVDCHCCRRRQAAAHACGCQRSLLPGRLAPTHSYTGGIYTT